MIYKLLFIQIGPIALVNWAICLKTYEKSTLYSFAFLLNALLKCAIIK